MKRSTLVAAVALAVLWSLAAMPAAAQCPADVTGNGTVDGNDLDLIIVDYGCTTTCAGDVNGNGVTGENDYVAAQGNLGACPVVEDVNGSGTVNIVDMSLVGQNDGLDCRADVDDSGTVDSSDAYIVAASVAGSADALPLATADVDGNGSLTFADVLAVFSAGGRDCRTDVDRDGTVEGSPGEDDFDQVCRAAGFC